MKATLSCDLNSRCGLSSTFSADEFLECREQSCHSFHKFGVFRAAACVAAFFVCVFVCAIVFQTATASQGTAQTQVLLLHNHNDQHTHAYDNCKAHKHSYSHTHGKVTSQSERKTLHPDTALHRYAKVSNRHDCTHIHRLSAHGGHSGCSNRHGHHIFHFGSAANHGHHWFKHDWWHKDSGSTRYIDLSFYRKARCESATEHEHTAQSDSSMYHTHEGCVEHGHSYSHTSVASLDHTHTLENMHHRYNGAQDHA